MKKSIAAIFISSVFSALIAIAIYHYFIPHQTIIIQDNPISTLAFDYSKPTNTQPFTDNRNSIETINFVDAAQESQKAVVFISAMEELESNFFSRNYRNASGSGVIISSDGYIVTNNHVIKDADKVLITLYNKREYEATKIGTDSATDLALLKIDESKLPFLNFGDSDALQIGEWVLAIGNPFRLRSTVTAGIVSAKGRNINILERSDIESFIQTDAAVNPGNSGGALINIQGQLIGVNTAIMTQSGGYEGFSFAIPANLVKKVVYDIREFGAVQRGWLGVTITNVNDQSAQKLNLPQVAGVIIDGVISDGAAFSAGLKKQDVVLAVNGIKTNTTPEFMEQVAQFRPGDEISLTIVREGSSLIKNVTLRNFLNTTGFVSIRKDKLLVDLGFELRNLDSSEQKRLNIDGVKVVSIYKGSIVDDTKMEPGFIIKSINNKKITSVEDIVDILSESSGMINLLGMYEEYPGEFPYQFIKK